MVILKKKILVLDFEKEIYKDFKKELDFDKQIYPQ